MSQLIVEICKVNKIEKHPNADKLSIITIKGWRCIVGLDQYKEGDLVIFCPPDSIIPTNLIEKYKLEFLKKNGRVGTIKLRGEISQGLILDVPEDYKLNEGMNVAEMLGITKYEVPEPAINQSQGQVTKKKLNPLFDKYTDIENFKHFSDMFLEGEEVIISEKIHGSNFRVGNLPRPKNNLWNIIMFLFGKKYEFVYGSHTVQKKKYSLHKGFYKEDIWYEMVKKYNLDKIIPTDYIIYGEIYGEGIQDLTYGIKGRDLIIFDIKYKNKYLDWCDVVSFCIQYNLPYVPVLFEGQYTYDTLKLCTDGKSLRCSEQIREGCVIKPKIENEKYEYKGRIFGRKILKNLSEEYLLRKNATEFR